MLRTLEDFVDIVGEDVISNIHKKARKLYSKHIFHINSTFLGGGVAEILSRLVPLMNDIGIDTGWRTLHGTPAFFDITKKFHNALQSGEIELTEMMKNLYMEINQEFSIYTHINHDCVIVHDPQPLPLIKYYKKRQPWIWRCHIDLSEPNQDLWNFLKRFILRYDVVIVSSKKFMKEDLPVRQKIIHPAIDPLSMKNMELSDEEIAKQIKSVNIPTDKPLITQVSRMDPWKDPEGVLEVFKRVKERVDCRLLYCYNLATDDPEGLDIYNRVYKNAKDMVDKGDVLFVLGNNDMLVNAIQRFSTVIIQKSTKEGFCLAVTEALWKGKPVVATTAGGIPEQIEDGVHGFLLDPHDYDAFADKIVELLKDKKLAESIGKAAKEHVRKNFLTTRLLSDYLDLLIEMIYQ